MAFQHLPVYLRWKERAPTGGPKPEAFQTTIHLREYGFPDKVGEAFLQTADTLKSVIVTRVPGKAATGLIDEGYCLKSFYVHAKSCDWGPMAGFVAQLPAFSKKGAGNSGFQIDKHHETAAKLKKLLEDPATKNDPYLVSSPFVHLGLTQAAFDRLFSDGGCLNDGPYLDVDPNARVGIACDERNSVFVEYLLLRDIGEEEDDPGSKTWYVFHRDIYARYTADESAPYNAYLKEDDTDRDCLRFVQQEQDTLAQQTGLVIRATHSVDGSPFESPLGTLWGKLGGRPATQTLKSFYPVRVAQNPYRTYDDGDPRNAITGDYDLFAVWPVAPSNRWEETIRLAEGRALAPPAELFGGALFAPILMGKNFSFQLVHAPNVYVEVIPSFKQIEGLEDPVLGNINDAVHLAAGLLNSLVYKKYGEKLTAPNVAFHSDEGGRPEVFEIEFPLAAFLPAGVKLPPERAGKECTTTKEPRGLVIANASEFMTLVELLETQANLPLAYGWLMHLILLVAEKGTLEVLSKEASGDTDPKRREKRIQYLDARQAERTKLGEVGLPMLRAQVWSLLTGYDIDDVLGKKDANQAMDQAAKVFFDLLYAAEDVYQMMTKIRAITMPPRSSPSS